MHDTEWKIMYTKRGLKDKKIAVENGFSDKINSLIKILKENPFESYPPFEKLIGDLAGAYSRRINREHRLVYSVNKEQHIVKIISLWLHYE